MGLLANERQAARPPAMLSAIAALSAVVILVPAVGVSVVPHQSGPLSPRLLSQRSKARLPVKGGRRKRNRDPSTGSGMQGA